MKTVCVFHYNMHVWQGMTVHAAPRRGRQETGCPWTTGSPAWAASELPSWSPRKWAGSPAACLTAWTLCFKTTGKENDLNHFCSFSGRNIVLHLLKVCLKFKPDLLKSFHSGGEADVFGAGQNLEETQRFHITTQWTTSPALAAHWAVSTHSVNAHKMQTWLLDHLLSFSHEN